MKQANEFAEENGMKFIETSATTNLNVDEAFEILIDEVIKNNKDILKKINNNIILTKKNVYKKKVGGCC